MEVEDIKIGDGIRIFLTGSYDTTISDLNETHFKLNDISPYFSYDVKDFWFDRKLIGVTREYIYNKIETNPEIYFVELGALQKEIKKNENIF